MFAMRAFSMTASPAFQTPSPWGLAGPHYFNLLESTQDVVSPPSTGMGWNCGVDILVGYKGKVSYGARPLGFDVLGFNMFYCN